MWIEVSNKHLKLIGMYILTIFKLSVFSLNYGTGFFLVKNSYSKMEFRRSCESDATDKSLRNL